MSQKHPFGRTDLTHEGDPILSAPEPLSLEDQIRLRAYAIWEARGGGDGHALEDWLAGESQLADKPEI